MNKLKKYIIKLIIGSEDIESIDYFLDDHKQTMYERRVKSKSGEDSFRLSEDIYCIDNLRKKYFHYNKHNH